MASPLAAVPEATSMELDNSAPAYAPQERMEVDHSAETAYRDSIRIFAAVLQRPIHSIPATSSSCSGNSVYSGASYLSNDSGLSASGGASFRALRDEDLKEIARGMHVDGDIEGLVVEFSESGGAEHFLERWFKVLAVDWVLRIDCDAVLELQGYELQQLVERWSRALTVIIRSIMKLDITDGSLATEVFLRESIGKMICFLAKSHYFRGHPPADRLQAMLHIYISLINAQCLLTETAVNFNISGIIDMLSTEDCWLENICTLVGKIRTLIAEDSSWTIYNQLGGSEVHENTRFMLDCISSLRSAVSQANNLGKNLALNSLDPQNLCYQIDHTISYLKDVLGTKSELCSDPSLRYLFLLNNFYFVAQMLEPEILALDQGRLPAECERYLESYFVASWTHVLSCLSNPGPTYGWNKASSLAKFESAFHRTYQAHKFWKIPDPKVRDKVRKTITERVISGYRKYMEDHPELQKYLARGSSTPDALEEMLGELFEG